MAIELPPLPYAKDALAPIISAETIDFHYGKHHQTYVTNLNNQIKGTEFENLPLEEIIKKSSGGMFNNAAQVWNHTFYWNCLKPGGGGDPGGKLSDAINEAFGSFAAFKDQFTSTRADHVRLRLGLVGTASGRFAGSGQHIQRRHAVDWSGQGTADLRRLGARLLHRLPQRAREVRRGILEPGQLGFRYRTDGLTLLQVKQKSRLAAAFLFPQPASALSTGSACSSRPSAHATRASRSRISSAVNAHNVA